MPSEDCVFRRGKHSRIIPAEMQAAALSALQGAANDKICRDNEIAKFDKIVADPEV